MKVNSPLHVHELLGMPNSGKTIIQKNLKETLSRKGYKVILINEGANSAPLNKTRAFIFNAWVLADFMKPLLELTHDSPANTVTLLDRGPFDRISFHTALYKYGKLSKEELKGLNNVSNLFSQYVHSASLLICRPEISMKRDEKHNLNFPGIFINIDLLKILYHEYVKASKHSKITMYDSETLSIDEIESKILEKII